LSRPSSRLLRFRLQPIFEIVSVFSSALFIQLVGANADSLLERFREILFCGLKSGEFVGFHWHPPMENQPGKKGGSPTPPVTIVRDDARVSVTSDFPRRTDGENTRSMV
jgi:hypothetical protein